MDGGETVKCGVRCALVQNTLETDPTNKVLAKDVLGHQSYLTVLEKSKAQQISRITWLTQGDRNSRFFNAATNSRFHSPVSKEQGWIWEFLEKNDHNRDQATLFYEQLSNTKSLSSSQHIPFK